MFFNICSYEIIQNNEDQPENVSTMRTILGTSQYLYVATQRDPVYLVNILRICVPRMLVHIIKTNHGIFNIVDPMGSLYRQGSYHGVTSA